MKVFEAIDEIKSWTGILMSSGRCSLEMAEAQKMAIEALEKQMPKKPIEIDKWGEYYKCPICDKYAVDNFGCKYKFCRECGQKLDWQTAL